MVMSTFQLTYCMLQLSTSRVTRGKFWHTTSLYSIFNKCKNQLGLKVEVFRFVVSVYKLVNQLLCSKIFHHEAVMVKFNKMEARKDNFL